MGKFVSFCFVFIYFVTYRKVKRKENILQILGFSHVPKPLSLSLSLVFYDSNGKERVMSFYISLFYKFGDFPIKASFPLSVVVAAYDNPSASGLVPI